MSLSAIQIQSVLPGEGGVNESSPARRSADVASADERKAARTSPPAGSTDMPTPREHGGTLTTGAGRSA